MRAALAVLLIAVIGSGCASSQPPQTASVAPPPSPAPSSVPPPPPPPPLITPRVDNEEQAVRDVNARLARASQLVAQVDATKLTNDQQEMLSGLRDFISKANDALQAHDVPRAKVLADKASRLADDLAVAVKKTR
jgi:hypothetical protein